MAAIPTVKTFCGCCDLKTACVVIAWFRIVGAVIAILVYFVLFAFFSYIIDESDAENMESERDEDEKNLEIALKAIIYIALVFKLVLAVINICFSYLFIQGANSKNPAKMKYYLFVIGMDIVYLLYMSLHNIVFAAGEGYILLCSYSLYQEYMNPTQEDAANVVYTTENTVIAKQYDQPPPPQYYSCESDMQGQMAGQMAGQVAGQYPTLHP